MPKWIWKREKNVCICSSILLHFSLCICSSHIQPRVHSAPGSSPGLMWCLRPFRSHLAMEYLWTLQSWVQEGLEDVSWRERFWISSVSLLELQHKWRNRWTDGINTPALYVGQKKNRLWLKNSPLHTKKKQERTNQVATVTEAWVRQSNGTEG